MANDPISGLPQAIALTGDEFSPVVQAGVTKRARVSQFDLTGQLPGSVQDANTVFAGPTSGSPDYPSFRDLVPADIPNGLPSGGSTGQQLVKLSATNYDVGWVDDPAVPEPANTVLAGPTSGPNADPTFRALVNADIAPAGAALTRTSDTNVTLTLGGAPTTALVNAASITAGWSGQLAVARGGTGLASATAYAVLCGGTSSTNPFQSVASVGTTGQALLSNGAGALPTFQTLSSAVGTALTRVDDTNVTLTLGGAPTTALLSATSITAGWTGTLAASRGGTGFGSYTVGDILYASGATALSKLAATTSGYHLQTNGAASAPTYVGFVPLGAGAETRTWQDKDQDIISVLDFIPPSLHAGIRDGSNTTDLATYLAAARTYVGTLTYPAAIVFPGGRYRTSVSPNWALSELSLITLGEVYWDYTGTGNCFIVDGGASPASGVINMYIGKFIITGTSSALNGAYFRSLIHCAIDGPNVRGCGTTYSGILTEFCVLSQWNKPTCSNNECPGGTFGTAQPANGMKMDQRAALNQTAYCTVYNPILEGVPVGMYLAATIGNTIVGGAMEGCSSQGLLLATTAVYNKIYGCDYEVNTQDIYCAGDYNSFIDCDSTTLVLFDGSTLGNILKGGVHKQITIQSSGTANCIEFARYNWDNSGATISDSGTNTRLFMNMDMGAGTWSKVSTENIAASITLTTPNIGAATGTSINLSGTALASGGVFTADGASFGWGASTASIVGNSASNLFVFYTGSTERLRIANTAVTFSVGASLTQTVTAVGTGAKTISNAADSSTNLGKYLTITINGTTYYIPCGTVALT